ncbi:MAG: ABC transporter ATP-binding protein, partial [Candidatus Hodarchaeota archaeon]
RAVLKGVNLEIKQKEIIGIFGSSGSGKSTLLNVIAGFLKPDAGIIEINNNLVNEFKPKELEKLWRETITFIFQDPFDNVFPELSIKHNILLACSDENRRKQLCDNTIKQILKNLKLDKDIDTPCCRLSGGELQRVSLSIALARNSKIILLDEPTGELDSDNSERIFSTISNLCHERNLIVIVVSHNPLALKFVDHAYSLLDGKLIEFNQKSYY